MASVAVTRDPVGSPITESAAGVEPGEVWIDDGGLLRRGAAWVPLPDIDWRMADLLLQHLDQLVRREQLAEVAWPDRQIDAAALNVRIKMLRTRLEPLGLVLTTVRGRGYVLSLGPHA